MTSRDRLILIRAPKCLLALLPAEVVGLLRQHPEVWTAALRRGKALRRAQAEARRGRNAAQSP